MAELCRRAEATGADSLWAVDHLFWPHPMGESLTTLAVAAGATSRATLGTCVLQLPLRRPAAVAKQATALQLLSGGRFVLGLGVGIHEGEYVRAGVDYHRRGRLMDLGIAELRAAWAGGQRRALRLRAGAVLAGRPRVDRRLERGGSPAGRRRGRRLGPALPHGRRLRARAGRAAPGDGRGRAPPDAVEAGVVVFAYVGEDEAAPERGAAWLSNLYRLPPKAFGRHLVAGSPEACAASLRRFADAGARHILVMVAGSPAVEHFGLLRAAFSSGAQPRVLAEAPA